MHGSIRTASTAEAPRHSEYQPTSCKDWSASRGCNPHSKLSAAHLILHDGSVAYYMEDCLKGKILFPGRTTFPMWPIWGFRMQHTKNVDHGLILKSHRAPKDLHSPESRHISGWCHAMLKCCSYQKNAFCLWETEARWRPSLSGWRSLLVTRSILVERTRRSSLTELSRHPESHLQLQPEQRWKGSFKLSHHTLIEIKPT